MLTRILRKFFGGKNRHHFPNSLKSVGTGVEFDMSTELVFPERIKLGNHIYVGPNCYLNGRGGLEIHDHVIFAPQVAVMTAMHKYQNAEMLPYGREELLKPVTIEQCAWIGMRVLIMPGVTIGEGSIIGAGAVVTKSCEPGSILGGNPGRTIGKRDMNHYYDLLSSCKFYLMHKQEHKFDKTEILG
jgi:acetyltransferase-like isoleucine patch superfamily enzyme